LQNKLLLQTAHSVKPGGLFVYAVCTLTPEESDEQIARFLQNRQDFAEEGPPPAFAKELLDARGRMLTLPHKAGTDGFFAARLRRKAS
jgi:16S rRNA (cytosine967-C5)-methyltransferase